MTANEVDAALVLPADQVGPAVLRLAEDQWFDRKSGRVAAKDLGPALVAFANAEGGTLVVGLSSGSVEGIRSHARKLNAFRQAPIDFTVPRSGQSSTRSPASTTGALRTSCWSSGSSRANGCTSCRTATATSGSATRVDG